MPERTAVANAAAAGVFWCSRSFRQRRPDSIYHQRGPPCSTAQSRSRRPTRSQESRDRQPAALSGDGTIGVINANNAALYRRDHPTRSVFCATATERSPLGCEPERIRPRGHGRCPSLARSWSPCAAAARGCLVRGRRSNFGAAAKAAMINSSRGPSPFEGPISGGAASPADGNILRTCDVTVLRRRASRRPARSVGGWAACSRDCGGTATQHWASPRIPVSRRSL